MKSIAYELIISFLTLKTEKSTLLPDDEFGPAGGLLVHGNGE